MMMCVQSVRYSIQVNEDYVGPIILGRGLHQGDPLSPYFFILRTEGLSAPVSRAYSQSVIHGNKICRSALRISHLFFADDSLLFCRATIEEGQALRNILDEYELVSGQAINYGKSSIYSAKMSMKTEGGAKRVDGSSSPT